MPRLTRRTFAKRTFAFGALAAPMLARTATAAVSTVRLGKQFGLPFVPQLVMESQRLIEKHAAMLGISDLKAEWVTMAGPAALNDALLSGSIEFINVSPPSLITLWEKTAGRQSVHALCAVQSMPYFLVTRNPAVNTIADFTEKDRIALPSVKISGQALIVEVAAAQKWGIERFDKLDPITVSMGHPDAVAAMLSGKSEITGHVAVAPFHIYELAVPGMRAVMKSYDVMGGRHTNGVQVTTGAFHKDNPKACEAVFAAHEEANAFIKKNPDDAARIYIELSKDKRSTVAEISKMIADPDLDYTTAPAKVMQLAEFMHKTGRIKTPPGKWQDLFLPQAQVLRGT